MDDANYRAARTKADNTILKAALAEAASKFLKTREAAAYLRLSYRTLEKMRSVGGGPPYRKHGRYVRYHIDDLEQWSAARTQRSTSERAATGPAAGATGATKVTSRG